MLFAKDKKFRKLIRLYWAEQLAGAATDRMIRLYTRLKYKRKRAFKEYMKKDKKLTAIYNDLVGFSRNNSN